MALFGLRKPAAPAGTGDSRNLALSDGRTITVTRRVDCLGDSCPRPQLMTKKALREAAPGDVIEIVVDNPSSMEALPPLCAGLGATHLETMKADRCWQVFIRKD
jgi:tRNA 2-thiouridine synthesizing protein A